MNDERSVEVRLRTDTHGLEPQDYKALQYLDRAADVIHGIYLAQTDSNANDAVSPPNMSREEMFADRRWKWDQDKFNDPLTQIRKGSNGLVAVGYPVAYGRQLNEAASLLDRAAACVSHQGLRDFLHSRAKALLNNKYQASDRLWNRLSGAPIEVMIGPYPDSFDSTLGTKSMFGFVAGPVLPGDTAMFADYSSYASEYQDQVLAKVFPPMRNSVGLPRSVTVIERHFAGGAAFSNDAVIGGAKTIFVQNLADAEFNGIIEPLAHALLKESDAGLVTTTAFAKSLVAQGLGASMGFNFQNSIGLMGRVLHQVQSLVLGQAFDWSLAEESHFYTAATKATALISVLRCANVVRIGKMRSLADVAQLFLFNFMVENQAIGISSDGLTVDPEKVNTTSVSLINELADLASQNDQGLRQKAGKKLIKKYNGFRPEVELIRKLAGDIPDEILPIFHD